MSYVMVEMIWKYRQKFGVWNIKIPYYEWSVECKLLNRISFIKYLSFLHLNKKKNHLTKLQMKWMKCEKKTFGNFISLVKRQCVWEKKLIFFKQFNKKKILFVVLCNDLTLSQSNNRFSKWNTNLHIMLAKLSNQ